MAKKFLTSLKLVNLNSDPSVGSEGELYFNSSASVAKIYKSGAWSELGAGGGSNITVSTTEPVSPETGDAWYKNNTGELYIYDGTYWVEVNGVVEGSNNLYTLSDVTLTSPTNNEVLAYDSSGSIWINQTADEAGLATSNSPTFTGSVTVGTDIGSAGAYLQITNDTQTTIKSLNNSVIVAEATGVTIDTGGAGAAKAWVFKNNGDLTFPDNSNQSTAFLGIGSYSTTNISEGTNLYYTDERAQDAVGNILGSGLFYDDPTGVISNSGVLSINGTINEISVSASAGNVTIGVPDSPIFVTPNIGVATATSINGTTIPSSKTLVVTTDIGSTVQAYSATLAAINTLGSGTGLLKNTAGTFSYDNSTYATTSGNLSQFAATTSSQLLGVISDETGTGALVFGTSPTFTTSVIGGATFSAFATTDNLTIGESTGYTNVTATNNILSGGTIETNNGTYTVTDNYSSRNIYGNGAIANYVINIANGTYSNSGEGEVSKTINIATTSLGGIGSLNINLGAQYGFTTLNGNVSLPSTTTIAGATIAGATFTGDIVFEGATDNNFETTLTVTDPTADRTITIPNATGTVALTSDLSSYAALSGATFTGPVSGTSLTLSGDLIINGTTTTINSTNLTVDDKNIELGSVTSPTDTTADGGGITLKGTTDKTFNWVNSTSSWTSSEHISLGTGKNLLLNGSTSGTITITPTAISGTNTITLPALTGTVALLSSPTFTGTVTIPTLNLTNALGYAYGGTGLATLGTAGQVLKVNAGATALEWGTISGGGSSFTDSAGLAALLSDETGSGSAVFSTSPTFTGTVTIPNLSINGQALMQASTGTTSATSSFDTTTHSSAEFIVYGSTSTGNYVSKVLMLARGTATPVITEYAILTQGTAPTVTITPSYSAPNAVLTVAVTSGTNIEIIATEVSI
jgi:hypothetical protein